jgi:hypothetical protein
MTRKKRINESPVYQRKEKSREFDALCRNVYHAVLTLAHYCDGYYDVVDDLHTYVAAGARYREILATALTVSFRDGRRKGKKLAMAAKAASDSNATD